MPLTDRQIKYKCLCELCEIGICLPDHVHRTPLIDPFLPAEKRPGRISYGVSSCGYDVRLAEEVLMHTPVVLGGVVEPIDVKLHPQDFLRQFEAALIHKWTKQTSEVTSEFIVIPPHGFALGRTVERISMPDNLCALCVGKSTYARCGLVVNTTPIEPGWEGTITLELSNTTNAPIRVYVNEGIAQLVFYPLSERPQLTYRDKNGKYQGQVEVTLPRVD